MSMAVRVLVLCAVAEPDKNVANAWIGGTKSTVWTWVDGSSASVLNCGRDGCDLWMPGQPGYVSRRHHTAWE